ncbi:MAG: hypothetical protein H5U40_07100 [Polyangiaceae bacterium]|nr:hypothetical protein [Polyangiaceae bacterium]
MNQFLFAKIVVAIGWAVIIAGYFIPGDSIALEALRASGLVLLAAHAIETVAFLPTLRRAGGSLGSHVARTLVFGMVYYGEVRARLADESSGGTSTK